MDFFVAQDIEKTYANHKALDGVSIQIPQNTIFGLLGPNGAGKTTLIRIINQITAPDKGQLFFKGDKLTEKHIRQIGYLPEERGLYKKMKVGEQALYLAQLKGLSKKDATARLKYWFEKFEIGGWWNKKVEELSKGMQQKVQFIVTILHEPEFLIFDEPFSGFDPINANLLKQEILELRDKGATIIFSTHNMSSVEELCDNIALINKSKNILSGSVREIKKTYKNNLFEIVCESSDNLQLSLPDEFSVLEKETVHEQLKLLVRIPERLTHNYLIETIIPQAQIISFSEILPSMNDIFIQKVKENTNETINA